MTLADITTAIFRKPRILVTVERSIEIGAYILLNDGRAGVLASIDMVQGEKRGYIIGEGFAASVTEADIFAYANVNVSIAA